LSMGGVSTSGIGGPKTISHLLTRKLSPPAAYISLVVNFVQNNRFAVDIPQHSRYARGPNSVVVLQTGMGHPGLVVIIQTICVMDEAQVVIGILIPDQFK